MIGCGDVRVILKNCSDWLRRWFGSECTRLSQSSNFWYFNFDISTQLELCLWSCQRFLGRWDGNVKCQINSSLENGMWVKEWRYLWYFISFIGGDDSRPQDVVQSGKSMLSGERLLCTRYHTCKLRGCWWPCCRSGENVKTASHSSCRIGYDSDFINVHEDNQFYDMMIEAMAGRRSFLVFIYWELESRQTRCLWSANYIENRND